MLKETGFLRLGKFLCVYDFKFDLSVHKMSCPVYIIPFSYENGMEMLSYENGIV